MYRPEILIRGRILVVAPLFILLFSSFLLSWSSYAGGKSANTIFDQDKKANSPREDKGIYGVKFGQVIVPEMVLISGGSFNMGQPKQHLGCHECSKDEQPVHNVAISTFEIGRFEVTNAQYHEFSKATGRETAEWRQFFKFNKDNHPVMNVSWNDANEYCAWLQALTGREYRLPTEAEWEYAARSGNRTNNKFIYGDGLSKRDANFDKKALYDKEYTDSTTEVGKYKPNTFGLYDMTGNVWEWCSDYYDEHYYAASPEKDPQGPNRGQYRVLRGCSFLSTEDQCRVANRAWYNPGYILDGRGFRIASSLKKEKD
jgi:formylglycine-generating enzyme required for sulfatase activity